MRTILALAVLTLPLGAAETDSIVDLGGHVEDVSIAGSGQHLVLKLKGEKRLAVLDTSSHKIETIELPSADFAFAAGADVAVVFLRETNELQSWDLKSLKMIKAKEFADPIDVVRMVMGHSWNGMAILRVKRRNDQNLQQPHWLLDVRTLSVIKSPGSQEMNFAQMGPLMGAGENLHYRASGDLSRVTCWASNQSPTGVGLWVRVESTYRGMYNHDSAGYLAIGDNNIIYTGSGAIMSDAAAPASPNAFQQIGTVGKIADQSLIPGLGGRFFLGIGLDGQLGVYQADHETPLCTLDAMAQWARPKSTNPNVGQPGNAKVPPGMIDPFSPTQLTLDKRFVFAPSLGYIAYLPSTDDRLVFRRFDLRASLEAAGQDYLIVLSSPRTQARADSVWTYTMKSIARREPVKYILERAPEGMTLSPQGQLSWKIPARIEGRGRVIVVVEDTGGKQVRHAFELAFD
jgi:hypothetical protein